MATLDTNRTTANTAAEHVADHNEVHRLHNLLDGPDPSAFLASPLQPGAGEYITFQGNTADTAGFAFADGVARFQPLWLPNVSITALACSIATVGSAGSVVRLLLYRASGAGLGALVKDAGTVTGTTTGLRVATFAAITPGQGWYWAAAVNQGAPATTAALVYWSSYSGIRVHPASIGFLTAGAYPSLDATGVTGAGPDPGPAVVHGNAPPIVLARR